MTVTGKSAYHTGRRPYRRFSVFFALILSAAMILSGCGKRTGDSLKKSADEASSMSLQTDAKKETKLPEGYYLMRVGHVQSVESPRHRSLLQFKKKVEAETDGMVIVEIHPAGELGGGTEMTDMVSSGELECVRGGDLEYLPKSTMLGLPMIADNIEEVRKICRSDFVQNMLRIVETDHGMKVLAVGDDGGFRQITNSVREIRNPDDMKGLKMRTVLEVIDLSMQAFGATTVTVPFTGLYDALKDGDADGQENPLAVIDSNRLYEVQDYLSIIDYSFLPELMYVNLDWWESLPEEYRTVISDAAQEMMEIQSSMTDEENEMYIRHIKESGCKVTVLTKEERAAFKPLAREVWQKYIENGRISENELKQLLSVVGKKPDL